jgi:hypothetical protein
VTSQSCANAPAADKAVTALASESVFSIFMVVSLLGFIGFIIGFGLS